jgi:hypothetical protein
MNPKAKGREMFTLLSHIRRLRKVQITPLKDRGISDNLVNYVLVQFTLKLCYLVPLIT